MAAEPSASETLTWKQDPPPQNDSIDAASSKEPEYVTGFQLALTIASVSLIAFVLLLDQSILATAIPQITSAFHSLPDVGWYTGAYQLGCATLQPLTGKLYTHLRTKHVFLAHLAVFEIGSLVCGVANSSPMLIGGRALAGLGASGLMNGGLTIVSNSTPLEKRPLYTGMMLGVAQMGIVSGPLVGGALTEHATWRWCFYMNLPIGAVTAIVLMLVRIPDPVEKQPYSFALFRKVIPLLDLPGFALLAPACVMFLLALQFGGDDTYNWNSPTIIGLFCGAGVVAIIFILWEAKVGDNAMIPGALLKNRIVVFSSISTVSLMVVVLVGSTFLPIYFQAVRGVGPTESGVDLLPSILSQLLFALISGAAVSKLGYYLPWAAASGVICAIGSGLLSKLTPSTATATWIGYLIVSGAGRGAGMQMALVAVQAAMPPSYIATSLAFLIFIQNLFNSVFVIVANTIFTQSLISNIRKHAPSVSPEAALEAGGSAAAVRHLVPEGSEELDEVLNAYNDALRNVWYLLVGFSCLVFAASWGMGWIDVRKKTEEKKKGAEKKDEEAQEVVSEESKEKEV